MKYYVNQIEYRGYVSSNGEQLGIDWELYILGFYWILCAFLPLVAVLLLAFI